MIPITVPYRGNTVHNVRSKSHEASIISLNSYLLLRNKSRTPKICYPKREAAVMPILFWDDTFLGCGFYFGCYGFSIRICTV